MQVAAPTRDAEILSSLRSVIDPDFGEDIVTCGFVKDLTVADDGKVAFTLELTTPACPVKDMFLRQSEAACKVGKRNVRILTAIVQPAWQLYACALQHCGRVCNCCKL